MHWRYYLPVSLLLLIAVACDKQGKGEESAILERTDQYKTAYNQKDIKAIGALWAQDGEFVRPDLGVIHEGRDAIEKAYSYAFAKGGDAKIELKVNNIAFPEPGSAVQSGVATLTKGGQEISKTVYKAVFEKNDGKWLIAKVSEIEQGDAPTNYEHLKELEWMIGNWIDEDEESENSLEFSWDRYKNFITQKFTLVSEGVFQLEGRQLIAWDPSQERIRSWVFDSDGGFGEGIWHKKGDSWVVETSHTLADGSKASATNIYTPIDKDTYRWESTGREVGGELLPDIEPVTVKRVKG
ncbi:YybH family protein [Estrella lausannensis]|uniref:Conserved putative secreted protein n=1 Tax=Estrella lausannensis TaxID=483423 RepID=A0A0H5E456_9BACT|nr:SgcJ/EcaC family oxidoreductase [Estrella lausannensis]CRX38010.1 Conserved putative secreted protein [Estrella lausannensis]